MRNDLEPLGVAEVRYLTIGHSFTLSPIFYIYIYSLILAMIAAPAAILTLITFLLILKIPADSMKGQSGSPNNWGIDRELKACYH